MLRIDDDEIENEEAQGINDTYVRNRAVKMQEEVSVIRSPGKNFKNCNGKCKSTCAVGCDYPLKGPLKLYLDSLFSTMIGAVDSIISCVMQGHK